MLNDFIQNLLKPFLPKASSTPPAAVSAQERAISHAKDGYKNAQDVVRLIDAKSTFFAGAAVLILGFTLQLLKQYFELPAGLKDELQYATENHPYAFCAIDAAVAFSLLIGVLSLYCSILSLVGRPPKNESQHIHTILFPFFVGKENERIVCHKITTGMTEEEVAKEYACQVWNVGLILQQKLRRNRYAALTFVAQIALLTLGGILLLFSIQ